MADEMKTVLAVMVVFLVIPAALGLAASSDWWLSVKSETAASHARSEAMFDPVE